VVAWCVCRKAVITTRILGLVHQLCAKRIHVTKRDLFYTDVKLFEVGAEVAMILASTCTCSCLPSQERASAAFQHPTCMATCTWCCRSKASQMQCWRTWHVCWGVHAQVCMVRVPHTSANNMASTVHCQLMQACGVPHVHQHSWSILLRSSSVVQVVV
jgi:hypothetical protein